jgi:hypothetical protein
MREMKRTLIFTSAVLASVALAFLADHFSLVIWDGTTWKDLDIKVTNSATNAPVPGVTVRFVPGDPSFIGQKLNQTDRQNLLEALAGESGTALTGKDGSAQLRAEFPSGGFQTLFRKEGKFGLRGTLLVSEGARVLFTEELRNLVPSERRTLDEALPRIHIALPGVDPL